VTKIINNISPLCPAPWNSILIETNKDVKPCCSYRGYLGSLHKDSVTDVISGPLWIDLKNKLVNHEWPAGCMDCKHSEERVNWSTRIGALNRSTSDVELSNKITYMEFNGSNICNLACLHCSPSCSSKWLEEWKELEKIFPVIFWKDTPESEEFTTRTSKFLTNTELILNNLEKLDYSNLRHLVFKGGEPILNNETLTVLQHLDKLSILGQLKRIDIFTNGTIVNKEVLHLLKKIKQDCLSITISLDGIGKLNEYIRYGKNSNTDDIIKNLEITRASTRDFQLQFSVSVMIYNIFNLVEIRDFWLKQRDTGNTRFPYFHIIVTGPRYLDPCILPDDTRAKLIEHYKQHQINNEFDIVITHLSRPYSGDRIHNQWVRYTEEMEKMRGNSIAELVPELKEFLHYKDSREHI
jgi:sulfatase maturation enzyme AslB (radical SAM superfamily)